MIDNGKFLVLGLGMSTLQWQRVKGPYQSIGVNDIGRLMTPDYLVCINPKDDFPPDRWKYVEENRSKLCFTHYNNISIPNKALIELGAKNADLDSSGVCFSSNSPYVGVVMAYQMGGKRIGLLGVDFTPDHFYSRDGKHPLQDRFDEIDREYNALWKSLRDKGVELYNLSAGSLLTIPKLTPEEF